jgi:hypothetical protein
LDLKLVAVRIPWLWYDYVTSKFKSVPWFPSLLLFAAIYGIGCLFALISGDLERFVRDLRQFGPIGVITFSSLLLSYAPFRMERLWTAVEPWLANDPEVVSVAKARTRGLLTRFFWLTGLIWAAAMVPFAVMAPDAAGNWYQGYPDPSVFVWWNVLFIPMVGYFAGAATALGVFGLSVFASHTFRVLDLRRGFILEGGKAALKPFNQMLWTVWGLFGFPAVLIAGTVSSATILRNLERGDEIQIATVVPPPAVAGGFPGGSVRATGVHE